jgi:hypothetical protein
MATLSRVVVKASYCSGSRSWEATLKTPPVAGMSPLVGLLESFSIRDTARFEQNIRPQVESGGMGRMRAAEAYVIGRK